MNNLLKGFFIFYLGSLLGCFLEEIWCFIRNKKIAIRRSMIYEPLIPIYGFAAFLIVVVADKVGYESLKVFIAGSIIASLVEYFSSLIQEKVFKTKSWDYSAMPFNLHGRINLLYSVAFGLFATLFIKNLKVIATLIVKYEKIEVTLTITFLLLIIFIIDTFLSLVACLRQTKRREKIPAQNKFEKWLDKKYPDEILDKIYNNSVCVKSKKNLNIKL